MTTHDLFSRYIELCRTALGENARVQAALKNTGIVEGYLLEHFSVGYADGRIVELARENSELAGRLEAAGILSGTKEQLAHCLVFPVFSESKEIENIVGYRLFIRGSNKLTSVNERGIFNAPFLKGADELIFSSDPIQALLLMQCEATNTTVLFGDDGKYLHFIAEHGIKKVVFTFEGRARLFDSLARNGVSARRVLIDFTQLKEKDGKTYLQSALSGPQDSSLSEDAIQEIEHGFLFRFPHLSYRVIGTFNDYSLALKANVKVWNEEESFVDSIDLYKNRDRQNLIFTIAERFGIRDQVQIEKDLGRIIDVIEKHREKKSKEGKRTKPELTEWQKETGMKFLTNPNLIDEIDEDYTTLGYVRERKNKLLLYLVMSSRLTEGPLHTMLISRSGAGKSRLVEVTESLCPPEDVESVSDLSPQALYYYGKDDLANRFVVIGEREGSQGAEYPLRELITKKSITKAIPMKDPVTSQIKTVSITVNGPIALAETTTNGELNPENLNRCFVVSIDESEEQTRKIHELQRKNHTFDGYLLRREQKRIIEKHTYAQRLLKPVLVFNPFAEALTFPSHTLRSRRDHEKFLRLINVICFLHQYQRKRTRKKVAEREEVEYIECTLDDYRTAYGLLAEGVLDSTLDDLPSPARNLLDLIKRYLAQKSERDKIPVEKIIFERKDIREYSSWSFAQVRNNFRTLREYEYIQLVRSANGLANQYRLTAAYSDLDFLTTILHPDELAKRMKQAG